MKTQPQELVLDNAQLVHAAYTKLISKVNKTPAFNEVTAFAVGSFVAGNCLADLLTGKKPRDIDIFFRSKEAAETALLYFQGAISSKLIEREKGEDGEPIFRFKPYTVETNLGKFVVRSDTITLKFKNLDTKIELIFKDFGSPEEICGMFDFAHAMLSYELNVEGGGTLTAHHPHTVSSIFAKKLFYVTGARSPLKSIFRAAKMVKRGWYLDLSDTLLMAADIRKLSLEKPCVLQDQTFGFYDGADKDLFTALMMKHSTGEAEKEKVKLKEFAEEWRKRK